MSVLMVERILPFLQRGEKALRWGGLPKTWPDDRVLCRLSSSAKDALTLADAKTGVLITGQTGKGNNVRAWKAVSEGLPARRLWRPGSLRENR